MNIFFFFFLWYIFVVALLPPLDLQTLTFKCLRCFFFFFPVSPLFLSLFISFWLSKYFLTHIFLTLMIREGRRKKKRKKKKWDRFLKCKMSVHKIQNEKGKASKVSATQDIYFWGVWWCRCFVSCVTHTLFLSYTRKPTTKMDLFPLCFFNLFLLLFSIWASSCLSSSLSSSKLYFSFAGNALTFIEKNKF